MACVWWKGQKYNPNLTAKNGSFYRQIRIISVSWRKKKSTAVKKCVFTHVSALNTVLIYHSTRLKQATHILSTPELSCESGPCLKYFAKLIPVECCSQLLNYTNKCENFSLTWCYLTTCHAPFHVKISTSIMTIAIPVSTMSGCLGTKLNSFWTLLRHKIHDCGSIKSGFSWMITIFCG